MDGAVRVAIEEAAEFVLELADAARLLLPELRLLFTTGYTPDAIVEAGRRDAAAELMPKPFTLEQLAVKVRGVLDA